MFANIKPLDEVTGLEDYITFLNNNKTNANGIDGAIYEGTVAKSIKEGGVPNSGELVRISNDGIPGMNRIDTTTDSWAIQIKHKTTYPPNYGVGNLGGSESAAAYLDDLVQQSGSLTPVFVTNSPITGPFQDLLDSKGILWQQVAD